MLAAYIVTHHSGRNVGENVINVGNLSQSFSINGRPFGNLNGTFISPNGSIFSHVNGSRTLSRIHPAGTITHRVYNYLTRVNYNNINLLTSTLTEQNRFDMYNALMNQTKPELIILAKIIYGNEDRGMAKPQIGQYWNRAALLNRARARNIVKLLGNKNHLNLSELANEKFKLRGIRGNIAKVH